MTATVMTTTNHDNDGLSSNSSRVELIKMQKSTIFGMQKHRPFDQSLNHSQTADEDV